MTDRKAAALANFRELWFLDLAYTDTGDVTAERLATLTELRKLNLLGTKLLFLKRANVRRLDSAGVR